MRVGCLQGVAKGIGLELVIPPPQLCTDNGVMVAWAGAERLALGLWEHLPASAANDVWVDVRPRWPLTDQCVASYSTCPVRRSKWANRTCQRMVIRTACNLTTIVPCGAVQIQFCRTYLRNTYSLSIDVDSWRDAQWCNDDPGLC